MKTFFKLIFALNFQVGDDPFSDLIESVESRHRRKTEVDKDGITQKNIPESVKKWLFSDIEKVPSKGNFACIEYMKNLK